ncbi:MAG: hypothetical protein LBL00_02275, partial [Endomicrobium sp.]|nr:hypothetical protein [Endomicrobium sp.]
MNEINKIIEEAASKIGNADGAVLESLKNEYIGKNGVLTQILKSLSQYSIEEKKVIGAQANKAKAVVESEIEKRK